MMLPSNLPSLRSLSKKQIKGKRVILRLDLNVPLENGAVADGFRIEQSLETIAYLRERGARIIIVSHIGSDGSASLKPVVAYLSKHVPTGFAPEIGDLEAAGALPESGVVVLENIRRHSGEEKNSPALARELAAHGDLYVNEAFSVSHRKHASVVGLPKLLPGYAGFNLEREVAELSKAFNPRRPFVFVLGGAKFGTKLPLLKKFNRLADRVFLGGALVHVFYKKKGWQIGKSLVDDKVSGMDSLLKSSKISLPIDVVTENPAGNYVKLPDAVGKRDVIMDAGPESVAAIAEAVRDAEFVLWNGPFGNCEKGYDKATREIARAIAESDAYSIVGGGDTLAAVGHLGVLEKFSFVSTGGGAMLDFLASGTLPGVEVLKKKR